MNCERFRHNCYNDIKQLDKYFGNGMSLQAILINSLCGVIIFNNLWLDEYESKDCLNRIITAEMVAKVDAEICKAIAESAAIFEYNNRTYEEEEEEEEEDIRYIRNAQNILNNWRFSMLAKIYSKEPILVKDLFVLQSNACYTDEFVQYEYSANNTLYLLKDIIAYIDKKYPHLNFKNLLTAVDEIQRII